MDNTELLVNLYELRKLLAIPGIPDGDSMSYIDACNNRADSIALESAWDLLNGMISVIKR